jgi:hypothetical protein
MDEALFAFGWAPFEVVAPDHVEITCFSFESLGGTSEWTLYNLVGHLSVQSR